MQRPPGEQKPSRYNSLTLLKSMVNEFYFKLASDCVRPIEGQIAENIRSTYSADYKIYEPDWDKPKPPKSVTAHSDYTDTAVSRSSQKSLPRQQA